MNYMYSFSDINTLYMIYARAIVKKKIKNRTGFLILEDAYIFGREISLKFKDSGKWTCLKNLQVMRGLFYVYGSCEFRTECKQIKIAWKMRKHWILVKKKKTTTTHDRVQVVHGVRALEGKTVIIISLESALHLLKSITCCTCTR